MPDAQNVKVHAGCDAARAELRRQRNHYREALEEIEYRTRQQGGLLAAVNQCAKVALRAAGESDQKQPGSEAP